MFRSSRLALLGCCLLSCSALLAQQRPEVHKILGISVEGRTSADPAAVIANTGMKVGDEITIPGDQTRTAIDRLYGLRLFDDIQILIENRTQDGIYLLIRLTENPRLESIEITGNDELSEDEILKKINLIKGQIVTKQDLSMIIRSLKLKYDEDGYLNAQVNPQLVAVDSTSRRVVLKIAVQEGPKVKVDKIRFFGNKLFADDDLKGEMKETDERRWWKFWSSNKFEKKKYVEDKQLILNFYRKNGFRDAEILADSLRYDDAKRYLAMGFTLSIAGPVTYPNARA